MTDLLEREPVESRRHDTSERFEATDPIALELLRSRLESIAHDAAITIERTGVSPTATETHDLSATLLDAEGNLIAGGGWVAYHWAAANHAVEQTILRHGKTLAPGDVFFANDPYSGGGLHPNDVFVERPIFVGDRVVAWVVLSAHLADMGGMTPGSFSPTATECYQEALRSPPVRLFRAGEQMTDVWDLLLTNVRMKGIFEMDLRALVAGSHVAQEKIAELVESVGMDFFVAGARELQALTERELRKRIAALPDGVYRTKGWTEWDDELYEIPCAMTIDGDRMIFDFEGASPQAPHFFNSQPYIIKSGMVMHFAHLLAADLPYTQGLLTPIEMRCPEGSIVHARPPAPMNAGHMHVGGTAAELMLQCVRHALWAASPPLPGSRFVNGWSGGPLMGLAFWSGLDVDGDTTIWGMTDGMNSGGTAGHHRDGIDVTIAPIGLVQAASNPDTEVIEDWYPVLVSERSVRGGINGPGTNRSGGGAVIRVEPYGVEELTGQMLGIREHMPLEGTGGGYPGSTPVYEITRQGGQVERISTKAAGIVLRRGEVFELRGGSAGGVGDPLEREPAAVAADIASGLITPEQGDAVYGVTLDEAGAADPAASERRRAVLRADRLARAAAPARPVTDAMVAALGPLPDGAPLPFYLSLVDQRGPLAVATASGAPLAIAPDHWTDGCAVLEERHPGSGSPIVVRAYLDPRTGTSLYVEVVPEGEPRSFAILPKRWTDLGRSTPAEASR